MCIANKNSSGSSSSSSQHETTTMPQQVAEVGPFDVLCGRDRNSYHNQGNRSFRTLIQMHLPKYMKCERRADRRKAIFEISQALQTSDGHRFRFLKRNPQGTLVVLNKSQSREKIAHALRDAASKQKKVMEPTAIREIPSVPEREIAVSSLSAWKQLVLTAPSTTQQQQAQPQAAPITAPLTPSCYAPLPVQLPVPSATHHYDHLARQLATMPLAVFPDEPIVTASDIQDLADEFSQIPDLRLSDIFDIVEG